jgi:hypothetical protein
MTEVALGLERNRQVSDALIIFGNGPVVDPVTREPASFSNTVPGTEDLKFWNVHMARAAWELFRRGDARLIIPMGGRTGGENYASEAELLAKDMTEFGVPPSYIKLEDESKTTSENIVNFLNLYVDVPGGVRTIDILATHFHLGRVRMLMDLFKVPYRNAFSSEEVLRYAARDVRNFDDLDQDLLDQVENVLDINAINRIPWSSRDREAYQSFYSRQKGVEKTDIQQLILENQVYARALRELPENWIGYVGQLNSFSRILRILDGQDQEMLFERFGIDPSKDSEQEIRKKLASIERKHLSANRSLIAIMDSKSS